MDGIRLGKPIERIRMELGFRDSEVRAAEITVRALRDLTLDCLADMREEPTFNADDKLIGVDVTLDWAHMDRLAKLAGFSDAGIALDALKTEQNARAEEDAAFVRINS